MLTINYLFIIVNYGVNLFLCNRNMNSTSDLCCRNFLRIRCTRGCVSNASVDPSTRSLLMNSWRPSSASM